MTQRHLTILTGASRGMGLAMAQQLIAGGHDLLTISRKPNDELAAQAELAGRRCEQWPQDLARADTAAARLETWLKAQDSGALASVTLINNAGLIPRIAPLTTKCGMSSSHLTSQSQRLTGSSIRASTRTG